MPMHLQHVFVGPAGPITITIKLNDFVTRLAQ